MPSVKFTFPANFLWGTSTSSHQVEGNNTNNNWSLWEAEPGRIKTGEVSGIACDWWGGRWREDFKRAADSGQNTLRLSIEWSRIQPKPDSWDESAIDTYREMIHGMISLRLRPMVTLHHFTDPIWFTEKGGWENDDAPQLFLKYAQKIVPALKSIVKDWVTINEPNMVVFCGYISGHFPPGKTKSIKKAHQVTVKMIKAHASVYEYIHQQQEDASVGISQNYRDLFPKTKSIVDRFATNASHKLYNNAIMDVLSKGSFRYGPYSISLPKAKNTLDFVGLNYYSGNQVHFTFNVNEFLTYPKGASLSDNGFVANEPESFYRGLTWASSYGVPVIVTENGVENDEDTFRREYLAEHIHQLWRAWSNGMPIRGYYHWSLVDNFEWENGWSYRFGLWRLNIETQERTKRPSVDFYEQICRKNCLDSEDVAKFAPNIYRFIYPN